MATNNTVSGTPTEAALEWVKELNEQFLSAARKSGNVYVDSYEDAVDRAVALELKLAGLTQQERLKGLIEAQALLSRELGGTYATAARGLLK